MHRFYNEFISYLDQKNKDRSIQFILSKLQDNSLDVVALYDEILTPALYAEPRKSGSPETSIWEEHVRTSIVRTIIECCFPYVIKEREEKYHSVFQGRVVCFCPPGELHEIGARMVSDFFSLCGFEAIYVGANTPEDDIINAIKNLRPKYVAISITNYYNLVSCRKAIERIGELRGALKFQIILGGQACRGNSEACREMSPDMILNSFPDIQRLVEGGTNASS